MSVQVVISTIIARFRRNQRGAAIFSGKLANGKSSTKNHGEMYEGPVSWHPKDVANVLISVGSNGSPPSNRYRAQSQYVEKSTLRGPEQLSMRVVATLPKAGCDKSAAETAAVATDMRARR